MPLHKKEIFQAKQEFYDKGGLSSSLSLFVLFVTLFVDLACKISLYICTLSIIIFLREIGPRFLISPFPSLFLFVSAIFSTHFSDELFPPFIARQHCTYKNNRLTQFILNFIEDPSGDKISRQLTAARG